MPLQTPEQTAKYLRARIDQLTRARRIIGNSTVTGSMLEQMIDTYRKADVSLSQLLAAGCVNAVYNLQRAAAQGAEALTPGGKVDEENTGQYLALSEIMLGTDGIFTLADMKGWATARGFDFDQGIYDNIKR